MIQSYLHAFTQWLRDLPTTDPLHGLRLLAQSDDYRTFGLPGWPESLHLEVQAGEVSMRVYRGEECWDILVCFESSARLDERHQWFCADCLDAAANQRWPSAYALWAEHDFEALHAWMTEHLLPATRLELHRMRGVRWAQLAAGPAANPAQDHETLVHTLEREDTA